MTFATLLDAAAHLIRSGYRWNADYERFERDRWSAYLYPLKDGQCRVEFL